MYYGVGAGFADFISFFLNKYHMRYPILTYTKLFIFIGFFKNGGGEV